MLDKLLDNLVSSFISCIEILLNFMAILKIKKTSISSFSFALEVNSSKNLNNKEE